VMIPGAGRGIYIEGAYIIRPVEGVERQSVIQAP